MAYWTCYKMDVNLHAMTKIRIVCNDVGNTITAIDKRVFVKFIAHASLGLLGST